MSIEAWRAHAERHARSPGVTRPVESYDLRPRPLSTGSWNTDPYALEAKRNRYKYDERNREVDQRMYALDNAHRVGRGGVLLQLCQLARRISSWGIRTASDSMLRALGIMVRSR